MKGTLPGPKRPAAATPAATHSSIAPTAAGPAVNPNNRITTLTLLEESPRARGYDPYNAAALVHPRDALRKPGSR